MYPLVMTNSLLLKMAIEIVDFPIKNSDFPVRYVKLPEGISFHLALRFVLSDTALSENRLHQDLMVHECL